MRRRRGRVRERARGFTRPHWRVDPAIGEETFRDRGHFGGKTAIRRQHHLLRLGPGDGAGGRKRQRRVAVPMRELLLFEPAGLQIVIAMREPRIGRTNRTDQGIDDLALDAVVQVARIRDILKATPTVGNFLVLGERIGDEREGPLIVLEGLGQRLACGLALVRRAVLQQIERRLDRQLLTADLEAQAGDGLVEQPVPGGIAALGFFVKQLLDAIFELVRLVLAQILDPRPVMGQVLRLHRTLDHGVVDAVELKPEEQQMYRGRRQPLGDVAIELGNRRIDAVAGMNEAGIGAEPAGEIVDRLVAPDGLGKPASAVIAGNVFRELALVIRFERCAVGIHLLQIARDFGRVDTGIKIGEVPFRQLAGFGFGGGRLAARG